MKRKYLMTKFRFGIKQLNYVCRTIKFFVFSGTLHSTKCFRFPLAFKVRKNTILSF